jgi:hypothetical protein
MAENQCQNDSQFNDTRPLLTFCFNADGQIWEQDMWNNQILYRVHDILAQRTNQIFPHPEPVLDENCLLKIQTAQNQQSRPKCGLTPFPLRPDDNSILKSPYNSHYKMAYPPHQQTNIRDVDIESDLFMTVDTPLNRDCLTIDEARNLETGIQESNRQLYKTFHKHEIHSPAYPNLDRTIFDNVTKEIYSSVDTRNRFILYQ